MTPPDNKILERVRNLIAKAESSEFEDEANSFMAKAQELMAKHSIVEAMFRDSTGDRGSPTMREIVITKPYVMQSWSLLSYIAKANRCTAVGAGDARSKVVITLFGFEDDIETVEMLYTSLLLQAARLMGDALIPERVHARTFRRSWLEGYAYRIGQRLSEARKRTEAEVAADYTGGSVALVLVDRDVAVEQLRRETFPRVSSRSSSSSVDSGAYSQGQDAGRKADIGNKGMGKTPELR